MREIKFRAIIKEKNATVYFTLQDLVNPKPLFSIRELLLPWLKVGSKPDEYIGLKDKKRTSEYPKGQDIYGGDIIKDNAGFKYEVGWARAQFFQISIENDLTLDGYNWEIVFEVIGNISQNPELRKEEK